MRTLEVEFGQRAHIAILERIESSEEAWQIEEIAAQFGGSVHPVEGRKVIENGLPNVPATSRDTVELRVTDNGAEVVYIHPNRRPDSPASIRRLVKPGDNHPVFAEDPTGNRNVVSKAYVVVK